MNTKYLHKVLAFVFLLFFNNSFSQNTKLLDSLKHVLKTGELSKKEKSKLLSNIAYYHPDIDSSLLLAKQALVLAEETKELVSQGIALEEISNIQRRLGNNSSSLEASLKALQIYESLGMKERQAASYGQLAGNSISDEEYSAAIAYLKKALEIYTVSDRTGNRIIIMVNLGEAYRLAKHLDSATVCFKKALQNSKPIKDDLKRGYALGNLGMVYSEQNKFSLAKKNLNEAISILTPFKDSYSISTYTATIGEVLIKEGKLKLAEEKLLQALTIARSNHLKEQIRDFSKILSNLHESQYKYREALTYQKLYQVYQDSLVNKAAIKRLEQVKAGYQINKRESEIGLLNTINKNQERLVIILIIGVFLLLFFAYLLYKGIKRFRESNKLLSRQKITISKREQEKALLLSELNHRVKNNLQMITSLLNLQSQELSGHPAQEAITEGKYRVEALSLVHRKLYQEGADTRIQIKEYIEELVLGLFHGYNAKFTPDFDIEDISLKIDIAIPAALIINELITNSLKYAYRNTNTPLLKIAMIEKPKNYLHFTIIDNGIGFTNNETEKSNSFGLKLITSLVKQLEGSIKKVNGKGTHWNIIVKTT